MKSVFVSLLLLSQISMAASQSCDRQLESMLYRTREASRLETASIHTYDAQKPDSDIKNRQANRLWELAQKQNDAVESMKADFKLNCLK